MKILSYNQETRTLRVELPGFPNYEVFDVPIETFDAMREAESPQTYFNEHIWGNNFEHDFHWPNLQALLKYLAENMFYDSPVTVRSTRGDQDTPLHIACVWGDLSAIELLLSGGAEVNARGDLGTTPIFNAVSFARIRSVALLLKAGATVDDANELQFTARQIALRSKNLHFLALIPKS